MEKEFVTYEQALALKELGFDEECFAFYNGKFLDSTDYNFDDDTSKDIGLCIKVPLNQQVFRWFREEYEWYANISSWIHEELIGTYHEFEIYGTPNSAYGSIKFKTYEEAENVCIDKLIELAKQK